MFIKYLSSGIVKEFSDDTARKMIEAGIVVKAEPDEYYKAEQPTEQPAPKKAGKK